ncbi:Zinc finger RNA-binding protein [Taenia solium]|eukprot:TsM_000225000 transcript=TsM_000225000 gene=TsM_000225000
MAHKNRISLRPTPQVYAPPPVFQRQVASPQVYIPPNSSDLRFAYPSGALSDYQTHEGTSFWSRSSSYYKCPPFIRSPRDSRNIPGVSRVSYKNSPSETVDSVDYYCEVCKVNCVGKQSYTAHLAGQKHKKKLKQQEQQHKHQRKAQFIINNEKAKYPCKTCGISCTGKVSYDAHLLGSKHQKNVESAAYIKRLGCAACGVECNSQVSYEEHITSQKHKRNVRQQYADKSCVCKIPEEAEGKTKELQCPLCNIKCSGVDTYRAHLSGKQHQRAVKLQTTRGFAVPDCETVLVSANQKNWMPSSYVDLEDCIEEVLVGKVMHFRCRLCECTFSDLKAKNVHENGKKHQTALRRFKAASSLPFSSASRSTPSAQNDEESSGSCGVTVSTQRPLSPRGPVPTASISSVSSSPSKSFLVGRPHFPPTGSGFARPPGPCVPPSGLQALVSLPPHALADERYMQTKLRCIAPSEEENERRRRYEVHCTTGKPGEGLAFLVTRLLILEAAVVYISRGFLYDSLCSVFVVGQTAFEDGEEHRAESWSFFHGKYIS